MPLGNYGSAFVEVLVSRSGDDGDNYEVLILYLAGQIFYIVGLYFTLYMTRYCWSHPVSCPQLRANLGITQLESECLVSISKNCVLYEKV